MKNLIKIPRTIILIIILIFIFSIIFLFLILNYEIEQNIKINLYTKNIDDLNLYIDSNDINYIKPNSEININLNNKIYKIIVKNISFDNEFNLFKIHFINNKLKLYPNLKLKARIIYKYIKIYSFLFL